VTAGNILKKEAKRFSKALVTIY